MNALLDLFDDAESAFSLVGQQLEVSGQLPLRAIADLEETHWEALSRA